FCSSEVSLFFCSEGGEELSSCFVSGDVLLDELFLPHDPLIPLGKSILRSSNLSYPWRFKNAGLNTSFPFFEIKLSSTLVGTNLALNKSVRIIPACLHSLEGSIPEIAQ